MKTLNGFFKPKSIAVIGASSRVESVGYQILNNILQARFWGDLYPVNHKAGRILGYKTYASLLDISVVIDLAVIAIPATGVPDAMRQCGLQGIKNVIIITAGFSEAGERGRLLQQEINAIAEQYNIRFIGPNCLGVIRPASKLNATFGDSGINDGSIALLSQSGAVCTALLDYAKTEQIGFSSVVSLGSADNVDFGELLSYHATDDNTNSIVMYIESIRDGAGFIQGLQDCSNAGKKVILVKSGRSDTGSKAAASHTGAMVSNDAVFNAAIDIPGVTRIYSVNDLLTAIKALSSKQEAYGNRLAIITNAGGPGVMSVDYAEDKGIQLAELGQASIDALNNRLPAAWSHSNPIDVLGDATSTRYQQALEVVTHDPNIDAVLILLTPQSGTDVELIAKSIIQAANYSEIPILASFIGGKRVEDGKKLFTGTRVMHFDTPEEAIDAFSFIFYDGTLKEQKEYISTSSAYDAVAVQDAKYLMEGEPSGNILTTDNSKYILNAFGIPVTKTIAVTGPLGAAEVADEIGFPVVLKVNMAEFSHKSDADCVRLNLNSCDEVYQSFKQIEAIVKGLQPELTNIVCTVENMFKAKHGRELMIGVIKDPVFGHAISFGLGGTVVEILQDNAIELAPLTISKIERMIAKTKAAKYLKAFRNMPEANMQALVDVLLRVSYLVEQIPAINSLDINPIVCDTQGVISLDCRIEL
jgi:acetyltransferase